jgi:hypothetical protein
VQSTGTTVSTGFAEKVHKYALPLQVCTLEKNRQLRARVEVELFSLPDAHFAVPFAKTIKSRNKAWALMFLVMNL